MKKNGLIITIIAVIVLLHAALLYVFLGGSDAKKKAEKEQKQRETQSPAEFVATTLPVQPAAAKNAVTVSPEEYRRRSMAKANLGKPFDYAGAVNGNIPELKASAAAAAGILVDLGTRKVIWAKNAKKSVPIASMTKMMTVLLAYEEIVSGSRGVTLDTPVKVSVAAMKIGGSQVYLDPKETFPLGDLMRAASIQSANDAAYLIAEFLGGNDPYTFVARMNERAAQLRMPATRFHNPHGLPGNSSGTDNVSSPEGMARLAEATLLYPLLMKWASTWTSPFRKEGEKGYILMRNHNHLIPGSAEHSPGVDGLKTGFINRSGFCLTVTCNRGGRRMIAVVMGHPTRKERDRFVRALLDWGYLKVNNPDAVFHDTTSPVKKRRAKTVRKKSKNA